MGGLVACDLGVDGAAITGELLFAMRELCAAKGEAQCMDRGIWHGDPQRKWHRDPGKWLKRADHIHDVLRPIIKGVNLRVKVQVVLCPVK